MEITKVADVFNADPGDIIIYTITYKNIGTGAAGNVLIEDTIPADTTFVSSTPTNTSSSGDTYTWKFTNVVTGTYYIFIKVMVDTGTTDKTVLINDVTLDYTDTNNNAYSQESDSASVTVTAPILDIDKSADRKTADPGDVITYTIRYRNSGTGTAGHVWVNDTIPSFTTYVSSSPSYTSVSGDKYTWHFTNVPTGNYTIILKLRVDAYTADKTRLINDVTLDYTDTNNQTYKQESDKVIVTVTAPIMTVSKSADVSTADPHDVITYTITYKNTGTGAAGDVWIKDTIPPDTTFVSSLPSKPSVSGDTYTWHFTSVNTGTYIIELKVRVDTFTPDKSKLVNDVTLDYSDANGNMYSQEKDSVTVVVTAPIMEISKVADVALANPGDIIEYTITYKNTGTGVAGYVWVNDTIPGDTVHVSSTPAFTAASGNTYTWLFTDVNPGTYTIIQKVRVKTGTDDQKVLTNNVSLEYTAANGGPTYPPQYDGADVTVTAPVMSIQKTADIITVKTYIITDFRLRIAGEKWHNVELTPICNYLQCKSQSAQRRLQGSH
jgi:uncharacterized repeat protein (TIGR01451 family)